jgi:hypothetical protein
MSTAASLKIIDFHSHHVPAEWTLTTTVGVPEEQKALWRKTNLRIADRMRSSNRS